MHTSITTLVTGFLPFRPRHAGSSWSALPSASALDRRLQENKTPEASAPAVLIRLYLDNLSQAINLLGEQAVHGEVTLLVNRLRENLRKGDLLSEDLTNHGSVFALLFSKPRTSDPDAILRRLRSALALTELNVVLQYALVPSDGTRMRGITWHDFIGAQRF